VRRRAPCFWQVLPASDKPLFGGWEDLAAPNRWGKTLRLQCG